MKAAIELAHKVGYNVEGTLVIANLGLAKQDSLRACLVRSLFNY